MDMPNAAWIAKVLPDAQIVYDRFHVIKLMNERMDALRRSTMNQLADEQKKELKGKRYLFLRNIYGMADGVATARAAFALWREKAEASAIHCLKQMAKTIRKRIEGLLRLLEARPDDQREPGGLQQQDRMAHPTGLRIQGRSIPSPQDLRPTQPLHTEGSMNRNP